MTLFRSDQQALLDQLAVALQESADHFRFAADEVNDTDLTTELRDIAARRDRTGEDVAMALRDSGDLPSGPDIDRESFQKLANKLGATFAPDTDHRVLEQRLKAEQHLARLLADASEAALSDGHRHLIESLQRHVEETTNRLQRMMHGGDG